MVASAVIRHDGKYLLVLEGLGKAKGTWNFPGGHANDGETLEEAARRETKEETGLQVKIGRELIAISQDSAGNELHAFEAVQSGGALMVDGKEILDAKYFNEDEILASIRQQLRNPEYILGAIKAAP